MDNHETQYDTVTDSNSQFDHGLIPDSEEISEDGASRTLELTKKISAYLFLAPRPLSLERIMELTTASREEVTSIIEELSNSMRSIGLGFEILEINEAFHFRSLPELTKDIHKLITPKMKRLSKAAAETLAVVAYKQPVSKAEIEAIRGVDALPTIKTLVDGKLIRIVGREDTPGSPALYGTSDFFLERFGLSDLSELPTIKELQALDEETGEELEMNDFDEPSDEDDSDDTTDNKVNLDSHDH